MKKNQERKVKFIIIGIAALLVLSIIILLVRQQINVNERFFTYNGFQVEKTIEGYRLRLFLNNAEDAVYLRIREDPREIENITVDSNVKDNILNKKQIYITIDPEANMTGVTTLAALELDKVIDNPFLFNIPLNSAFTKQITGRENITLIDCEDATSEIGVIKLQLGMSTRVYYSNGCVIVEGKEEKDLVRATNKLDLVLLGVSR